MRQAGTIRGIPPSNGTCALPGRSPARTAISSAGLIVMLLAVAEPAAARPQIGSSSSASVTISVSVAPHYGLRFQPAGSDPQSWSGPYCMATNGPLPELAVYLLRLPAGRWPAARRSPDKIARLPWCRPGGPEISEMDRGERGEATPLLLIFPE